MRRIVLIVLCFLTVSSVSAQSKNYGTFVGSVVTKWLDDPDHRKMELMEPFSYIDPDLLKWDAPKGWIVDGASIPKVAWSMIGGPYEGAYRNASVIHDVACDQKVHPWQDVHRVFYNAMLAGGVSETKAKLMYAAVYYGGPRWPQKITLSGSDKQIQAKLAAIGPESMKDSTLSVSHAPPEPKAPPKYLPNPLGKKGGKDKPLAVMPPDETSITILTFTPAATTTLSEEQFERLRQFVEDQNPSLAVIEAYKP